MMDKKAAYLKALGMQPGGELADYKPDISYDPGGFFQNYGPQLAGKPYGEMDIAGSQNRRFRDEMVTGPPPEWFKYLGDPVRTGGYLPMVMEGTARGAAKAAGGLYDWVGEKANEGAEAFGRRFLSDEHGRKGLAPQGEDLVAAQNFATPEEYTRMRQSMKTDKIRQAFNEAMAPAQQLTEQYR